MTENEHQTDKPTNSEHKRPRYRVRPVVTPVRGSKNLQATPGKRDEAYLRPETEDDDGYDPFSDRPPTCDPTFEQDPWQ